MEERSSNNHLENQPMQPGKRINQEAVPNRVKYNFVDTETVRP
jgi:hypothetical protein